MKKNLSLLLLLALALSLAACKAKTPDGEEGAESSPVTQSQAPAAKDDIVLKDLLLTDNEYCSFRIDGVDSESDPAYALDVSLENKTGGKLSFFLEDAALNGYMCSPYWTRELEAGEKLETQIYWYPYDLELNAVRTVRVIEFLLNIQDETENVFSESYALFPYGDTISVLAESPREAASGETVLVDNGEYKFSITAFDAESVFDYAFTVYLENTGGKNVLFTLDKVRVSGRDCDPYWGFRLPAGRRANSFIGWMDLAVFGISEVEEIEFALKIYDADDWAALPLLYETFTVTPENP